MLSLVLALTLTLSPSPAPQLPNLAQIQDHEIQDQHRTGAILVGIGAAGGAGSLGVLFYAIGASFGDLLCFSDYCPSHDHTWYYVGAVAGVAISSGLIAAGVYAISKSNQKRKLIAGGIRF